MPGAAADAKPATKQRVWSDKLTGKA